jgi:hypothetical protein
MPAAIEAAPANAVMLDLLEAAAVTALALITLARVPTADSVSVPACTRAPVWFSAHTPEALTASYQVADLTGDPDLAAIVALADATQRVADPGQQATSE